MTDPPWNEPEGSGLREAVRSDRRRRRRRRVVLTVLALALAGILVLWWWPSGSEPPPTRWVASKPVDLLGPAGEAHAVTVTCPAGTMALGGAWGTQGDGTVAVLVSTPVRIAERWRWRLVAARRGPEPVTVTVRVLCGPPPGG